jgi:hypothetical protein
MGKWIPLPVKFKGIWYSPMVGCFNITLKDRFNPDFPPDRLYEELIKDKSSGHPWIVLKYRKPHEYAEPLWMSKRRFEEKYGKVEAILVDEEKWDDEEWYYTPDEGVLLIFTDKYVVAMKNHEGFESFIALPRDYKQLLEGEKQ